MEHHEIMKRREYDHGIGRLKRDGPFYGSIILTAISIGGFIATVNIMGKHQDKQDQVLDSLSATLTAQVGINSELKTMQVVTDNRLKSIEDWRNGVSDIYVKEHKRH